ncbi:MAG: response regulator, partial [Burkholderiaceae bacterium]
PAALPVAPAAAPAPAPTPAELAASTVARVAAAPPKAADQILVLLVDDSKMVRAKTGKLLAAHGFQVITAVDGVDAVKLLDTCMPDFVVTDVDMPGMDGFGLAGHLRGTARTAHIPIVMITSAEERHREPALRAGVGLVLGKPSPEDELISHLRGLRGAAAGPRPVAETA